MATQQYEKYWALTVEYTDIHGARFIETLRTICNHMNMGNVIYLNVQADIKKLFAKTDDGSIRKSVNQFIKLGFIEPGFKSMHSLTSDFLSAKTNHKREMVFSNIFYSNAKLRASYSVDSTINEIKFLIKTLEEVGQMTYDDIAGIMNVDLDKFPNTYLNAQELLHYNQQAKANGFAKRKKNQIRYLISFVKRMDDISYNNSVLSFKNNITNLTNIIVKIDARDNYLHQLYKRQLIQESKDYFHKSIPFCMVEKLGYPYLIASHIKPFIDSLPDEKYDPENGILLSYSLDSLFDKKRITFDANTGKLIPSKFLDDDLKSYLNKYSIDINLLTQKRKKYLIYHNDCFFNPILK